VNYKISSLESAILDIRLKLYEIQSRFGFESNEACYVSTIADECIAVLRKSNHKNTLEKCRRKIEHAFNSVMNSSIEKI
jgi:hypothetical protein